MAVTNLASNVHLLRRVSTTVAVLFVLIVFGDIVFAQSTPLPITVSYDFRNGARGWEAGFAGVGNVLVWITLNSLESNKAGVFIQ